MAAPPLRGRHRCPEGRGANAGKHLGPYCSPPPPRLGGHHCWRGHVGMVGGCSWHYRCQNMGKPKKDGNDDKHPCPCVVPPPWGVACNQPGFLIGRLGESTGGGQLPGGIYTPHQLSQTGPGVTSRRGRVGPISGAGNMHQKKGARQVKQAKRRLPMGVVHANSRGYMARGGANGMGGGRRYLKRNLGPLRGCPLSAVEYEKHLKKVVAQNLDIGFEYLGVRSKQ